MKYYRKKSRSSLWRRRSYYRKRYRRQYKKSYGKYKSRYSRRFGKRRFSRRSKTVKSLKGKSYKKSAILSGAEILASVQIINSYWTLYCYDLGKHSILMYGDLVKSLIGRAGYLQQPHWISVKLYKQSRDTPLFYAFLGDSFSSEYICDYINDQGLTKFLSDTGVRTRPWLSSLIQGERNDSCFRASKMKLFVILPTQTSQISVQEPKPFPQSYVDRTINNDQPLISVRDYFDLKITCGFYWHFDTCDKSKTIKEMPSFSAFAQGNLSDPAVEKLNKDYQATVKQQGKSTADAIFDSMLYGAQVVGDVTGPAAQIAATSVKNIATNMLTGYTIATINNLMGRISGGRMNPNLAVGN